MLCLQFADSQSRVGGLERAREWSGPTPQNDFVIPLSFDVDSQKPLPAAPSRMCD